MTQNRIAQDEGISVSAVEKHLQRAYRVVATLVDRRGRGAAAGAEGAMIDAAIRDQAALWMARARDPRFSDWDG